VPPTSTRTPHGVGAGPAPLVVYAELLATTILSITTPSSRIHTFRVCTPFDGTFTVIRVVPFVVFRQPNGLGSPHTSLPEAEIAPPRPTWTLSSLPERPSPRSQT
jgi:hypothetical protein